VFTIISSHVTGIRIAKNNEESRFYFKLHPVSSEFSTFEQMVKKYNLHSKDFKEKRELLLVKLKLFLANFFNIGDELYPPMTTWKRGSTTVPLVHPLPTSHQVNQDHLFLNGDSIIFGGYGTSNQKPHADFGCETQGDKKFQSVITPNWNTSSSRHPLSSRYLTRGKYIWFMIVTTVE
jgi:hypothetical protein